MVGGWGGRRGRVGSAQKTVFREAAALDKGPGFLRQSRWLVSGTVTRAECQGPLLNALVFSLNTLSKRKELPSLTSLKRGAPECTSRRRPAFIEAPGIENRAHADRLGPEDLVGSGVNAHGVVRPRLDRTGGLAASVGRVDRGQDSISHDSMPRQSLNRRNAGAPGSRSSAGSTTANR